MKRLALWRHAATQDARYGQRDFDRALTEQGRKDARMMGLWLQRQALGWGTASRSVWASPAIRVSETLTQAGFDSHAQWDQQLYLADAYTLMEFLARADDTQDAVLLAGHNPGFHALVYALCEGAAPSPLLSRAKQQVPAGSYAELDLDIEHWEKIADGCGTLTRFVAPQDLQNA